MKSVARIELMDCPMDVIDERGALSRILAWRYSPRRSHVITTVNAAILIMMRKDRQLREACLASDLIVADGMPLVWASRVLGTPLPERVGGCDLMQRILSHGNKYALRLFLLGAKPEVLDRLVDLIKRDYPGVEISGCRNGYFDDEDDVEIVRQIRESRADVLLVGMPCPRKEIWCHKYYRELNTPAILGVGGSFDVLAGCVRRAPIWMQRVGLEWLWRLLMEPRKLWRRYLVTNAQFLALLAMTAFSGLQSWLVFRKWVVNRDVRSGTQGSRHFASDEMPTSSH